MLAKIFEIPKSIGDKRSILVNKITSSLAAVSKPEKNVSIRLGIAKNITILIMTIAEKNKVKMLYTVPSFQNPVGVTMPADRRKHIEGNQ